jgi:hypothetical protein
MSDAIHSQASVDSEKHSSKPLDETVWRMWLKKNLLEESRRAAGRIKAVNWVCIGVLMAAMLVSSYVSMFYVSTYQAIVRLAIGFGGTVMLFESLRTRQYVSAALFAGLVVLFNPVFPAFALSGNWPILLASMLPFVASLVWVRELTQRPTREVAKSAGA